MFCFLHRILFIIEQSDLMKTFVLQNKEKTITFVKNQSKSIILFRLLLRLFLNRLPKISAVFLSCITFARPIQANCFIAVLSFICSITFLAWSNSSLWSLFSLIVNTSGFSLSSSKYCGSKAFSLFNIFTAPHNLLFI